MYTLLATLVATLHGVLVACVVFGALAAVAGRLRLRPALERAYYTLLGLVIASDLFLGECALTGLEQRLRDLQRPGSAYRGSFIGHYLSWLPPSLHSRIGPALIVAAIAAAPLWRLSAQRRAQSGKVRGEELAAAGQNTE